MGFAKLFKLLYEYKDVLKEIDLSTWEKPGTGRIGVDGYNWIYQVLNSSTHTSGDRDLAEIELVNKFMSKVSYLQRCGFTPYIVFDGATLAAKQTRRQTKDLAETVFTLIQTLECNNVESVVAPYEADAQLAYLLLEKDVDVILTEEADLILYGCEKIIFDYKGVYYVCEFSRLVGGSLFRGFTKEMVLQACLLGGCDFLPNLPGVGLLPAIGVMKKKWCKEMIHETDYLKVINAFKPKVTEGEKLDYIQRFRKVMNTYRHQHVYNRTNKTFVCLKDFPDKTNEDESYIGSDVSLTSPNIAEDIANGSIHPVTKNRMKDNIMHIKGGYVYSGVKLIDQNELSLNLEMEKLFRGTNAMKVLQEAMFKAAQAQFFAQCRQISADMEVSKAWQEYAVDLEVSKACQKHAVDHDYNFFDKAGVLFQDISEQKSKVAETYKAALKEKVMGPLNNLIDDASLHAARDGAELYSRLRQKALIEDDQAKLNNLKERLQTLYVTTHEALSSVERLQRKETSTIMVEMYELEISHCEASCYCE